MKGTEDKSPFRQTREVQAAHNINQADMTHHVQNSNMNTEFSPMGNRGDPHHLNSDEKSINGNIGSVSNRETFPTGNKHSLDPSINQMVTNNSQPNALNVNQMQMQPNMVQNVPTFQNDVFSLLTHYHNSNNQPQNQQ